MSTTLTLPTKPFTKLHNHSTTYPTSPIFGLLLGRYDESTGSVLILDVAPVSHGSLTSLLVEGSLSTVLPHWIDNSTISDVSNLEIVGVYSSNASSSDSKPSEVLHRVLDKISSLTAAKISPVLIMLSVKGSLAFYGKDNVGKWKRSIDQVQCTVGARGEAKRVCDFEECLEGGGEGWE